MSQAPFCYVDNNATTPVAPEVVEAMLPFLKDRWGNPSSAYTFGHEVGRDLDLARSRVAALIGATPKEIVFTSGGTESNNAAIHSALFTSPGKKHVVITDVEHSANRSYAVFLRKQGVEVTSLAVDSNGALDLDTLEEAIRPDTAVVSAMWANNETGILFPVEEVGRICRARNVLFHTDAVQAAGKISVDVKLAEADYLSLSAHKLHAPKGIGALFVRNGRKFQPLIMGGGQERGRRGGTENVPYIIGFGIAAALALQGLEQRSRAIRSLRDRLEEGILETIRATARNGAAEPRLSNTANIAFSGVEAEGILLLLDQAGICASSGSACTTGSVEPSHVLKAMSLATARARSSIRFSLGRYNTEADVEYVLEKLPIIIEKLRASAPVLSV